MTEQRNLDFGGKPTAGEILRRIREESRDESEKGRWFEQLFMRVALQEPEFEIEEIWRWADWPEREELTDLDGRDIGIDLVARRTTGEWVAIQCKCYDERSVLGKGHIDKFLGGSQQAIFELRWIVATCRWGPIAERAIRKAHPQVTQFDFQKYLGVEVAATDAERPVQKPWPLQADAVEDVVEGLNNHDRGRLVMACGTGKTFTSLRIAEQVAPDGGRILFTAPTIALVSQARREWLRQTTRRLKCVVVCSDPTAGGRNENEDIGISELECPVTTDPVEIAGALGANVSESDGSSRDDPGRGDDSAHCSESTSVVFSTYHSLRRVTEAQADHEAPAFDLAIADEAHRTTGALLEREGYRKIDFQEFHDDERLRARKRLYMTATPRIYTARSKRSLNKKGIEVVDMGDQKVYGPLLHLLPFAKAVQHRVLSDYRVIVLGVSRASVTPSLRKRLDALHSYTSRKNVPTDNDMTRVLGVSLAVNGVTEGSALERPGRLPRALGFANSIARSKWYAKALMESQVLASTTRRMSGGRAMKVVARHLDASSSALQRNRELRSLADAEREGEARMVCNVKLFTEGVDVPSLDAVAFLDPRDSQVDVVQAVGRVMRKAPGKRFGYIIVPVVVEPGRDVAAALERGTEGYRTVGRVLRALQAHDSRLAETPARFVKVYEPPTGPPLPVNGEPDVIRDRDREDIQRRLELDEAEQGIYAHVAAASGLGRPGQLVADEIADAVKRASAVFQGKELEEGLAKALDLVPQEDGGAKGVCTIAALMLANACLLHRRLRDEPQLKTILRLDKVAGSSAPAEVLALAWEAILEKDYAPVFQPALEVLRALPQDKATGNAIRELAECANRVADSLSELGYDHAGPLYHRILGSAKSDGAYYTNNLSAIILARLAFSEDLIDWSDPRAVAALRVIDPACGTGTLLMAALQTIKARVAARTEIETGEEEGDALHKLLVEDVLCGLDINRHGIQLAACNMTLGAPTVDYERMNLVTMPHGPQPDGSVKAGSVEILTAADRGDALSTVAFRAPQRSLESLDADQVNESEEIRFPLREVDGIIMNPPFTDNMKRGRKFGPAVLKAMQAHEIEVRDRLHGRDPEAAAVITTNSVSTFFTPLVERMLRDDRAFLAKVLPVTACTGASGLKERRFLAERLHIERIVTSHDPRRIAFSENTSIHESLLICRRVPKEDRPPTEFVSLRKMPSSAEEAIEVADAITAGTVGDGGSVCRWPAERVQAGDWTPVQWYDGGLAAKVREIQTSPLLEPVGLRFVFGPSGRAASDSWRRCDANSESVAEGPDIVRIFDSVSAELRRTLLGRPDQTVKPGGRRAHLYKRVQEGSGKLLLATRYDTVSGLLTAVFSPKATFGFGWVPVRTTNDREAKALVTWWNSTPARLMLLNRRSRKLSYPKWSLSQLRDVRIPKPGSPAWEALADAWEQVRDVELLPMRRAEECRTRRVIDAAAAVALDVGEDEIADWRRRLAVEPTITNKRAP